MNRWAPLSPILVLSLILSVCTFACATDESANNDDNDTRQQIEAEFGPLGDEHIAGFERELSAQYRQLQIHYDAYDQVRRAPSEQVNNDHEEHRLHRKMKRRHQTLARLHEDRMWLTIAQDGSASEDRQLAEAHRGAARWHEARFEDDGVGVEEQDAELEVLRTQFENSQLMPADTDGADPRS